MSRAADAWSEPEPAAAAQPGEAAPAAGQWSALDQAPLSAEEAVDEGAVKDADLQFGQLQTQSLYGPEGLLGQTGGAALNLAPTIRAQLVDKQQELAGQLTDPLQRRMFDDVTAQRLRQVDEILAPFLGQQSHVYNDETARIARPTDGA